MKGRLNAAEIVAAGGSVAVVCALLWYFHDRFWWPPDEGVYAYVAQRILAGDRLHLDLIDLHGGYNNWVNALAFAFFGEDLLSLRYPLASVTLVQSVLVFWLVRGNGPVIAATAALAAGSFSFIQFLNPSANWYALFLCIVTIFTATRIDVSARGGLALLGFLLGACFLTRQLSGVILAIGTLNWLMMRLSKGGGQPATAGRIFIAFLWLGLAVYILSKASVAAIIFVGLWPLWLAGFAFLRVDLDSTQLVRILGWLSAGAAVAAFPLVAYYAMNGGFFAWLNDIFFVALGIHGQDFIGQASFSFLLFYGIVGVVSPSSPATAISSLGWVIIILIIPVTGYLGVRHVRDAVDPTRVHPLPVIAPFWAVVSIHYQIPIYLFFALPIIIVAFLTLAARRSAVISILLLSVWAIVFQAGQPLSRGDSGIIEGQRVKFGARASLPRVSLRIPPEDQAVFAAVINHIEAVAQPGEALMTLPMEPELNFMTGRKSPVWYYGTPLGLRNESDIVRTVERLKAAAPLFVVHRREDKYLTPLSVRLLEEIRVLSPGPASIGPFDLYRFPAPPPDENSLTPDPE